MKERVKMLSDTTQVETYEKMYSLLQDVVMRLESGELPLDESLVLYEKGVSLAKMCQQLLDAAELHLQTLQSSD
jgi:exodeoxyribonuclease VII small subunit